MADGAVQRLEVADGTRLHALVRDPRSAPTQPPFLLVHGLASNAALWSGVAARLAAAGHRVVAVDQRSHGRSDPSGSLDRVTLAEDLMSVASGLGLARLTAMEAQLPASTWVLGIDEHTAPVLDLSTGAVRVEGRGRVTVRTRDGSVQFPTGALVELDDLVAAATGEGSTIGVLPAPQEAAVAEVPAGGVPLLEEIARHTTAFDAAILAGAAFEAAETTVRLEQTVQDWATNVGTADHLDRARAELRRQVSALARLAQEGLHTHRDLVAPHVETLLRLRDGARAERHFAAADAIRDALIEGGVEVRDSPEGTAWTYHDPLDGALQDG